MRRPVIKFFVRQAKLSYAVGIQMRGTGSDKMWLGATGCRLGRMGRGITEARQCRGTFGV